VIAAYAVENSWRCSGVDLFSLNRSRFDHGRQLRSGMKANLALGSAPAVLLAREDVVFL
jgi:hypothetical protein